MAWASIILSVFFIFLSAILLFAITKFLRVSKLFKPALIIALIVGVINIGVSAAVTLLSLSQGLSIVIGIFATLVVGSPLIHKEYKVPLKKAAGITGLWILAEFVLSVIVWLMFVVWTLQVAVS